MSEIVVVSGNPRAGSRTRTLAVAVAEELAKRTSGAVPTVIDVGEFGPRLLVSDAEEVTRSIAAIRAAGLLVIATPTYKGSYTGVLKVLLDYLPHQGLAGVVAAPVTVGATEQQAAASQRHLRGLLTELGAEVRPGLVVTEAQLGDAELAAGYAQALADAAN
jgi:FMN reductase